MPVVDRREVTGFPQGCPDIRVTGLPDYPGSGKRSILHAKDNLANLGIAAAPRKLRYRTRVGQLPQTAST